MTSARLFNRRQFLLASGAAAASVVLAGCGREPLLRMGSNTWPGYEFLHAAASERLIDVDQVRMIRMPSATSVLQALAAGQLDGAALTLDEVLTARDDGLKLQVVAVLDVSLGADMVLARPGLKTADDLRGRQIWCEQSAVGAVMLDAFLNTFQLKPTDVSLNFATVDEHVRRYEAGQAEVVVTFNPAAQEILALGAVRLFDSAAIPGRIVDTLTALEGTLAQSPESLRKLIAAHFEMLRRFRREPVVMTPILARGLNIPEAGVPACYAGLDLPDAMDNRDWLGGATPRLQQSALALGEIMATARLLTGKPRLQHLVADGYLPGQAG